MAVFLSPALPQLGEVLQSQPSTKEARAGRSEGQGRPQLHSEFEASLEYVKLYAKIKTKIKRARVAKFQL